MPVVDFDVLIDDTLANVTSSQALKTVLNKNIISLINDFEDGGWRQGKFENFLWDNIADTALSERERRSLPSRNRTSLISAAKNLRLTDNDERGEGSEIAEVFLYGVMRKHFGALPVVPKIFYKQNVNDNAKGADSVHIVIKNNDFTLWFGEAKFYNSIEDARLASIVKSVFQSLDTQKLKKERSIITSVSDLDELDIEQKLLEKIKNALKASESIDHLKGRLHIPILLLHECKITASHVEMSNAYRKAIIKYHGERATSYFTKQIQKSEKIHKYDLIRFHIILFPVPVKATLVSSFLEEVDFYKGRA